jgi:endonuclease/exonuclease/phosphatase family metal-dependent hydrolase
MVIKIFSWNMYYNNKDFSKALKFLEARSADVICLQEVPMDIVRDLKKKPWYVSQAKARHRGLSRTKTRNVILSRYPIKEKGSFSFVEEKKVSLKSRITGLSGPLEFQYVDIKLEKKKVRIFNSHLECNTSPSFRVKQFKQLLQLSNKSSVNIYCGDLNTYGEWYVNVFVGYISNYKIKDIPKSEKALFSELFAKHDLNDIFQGEVTYPLFRLQLDHILVPNNMRVVSKNVYKKRYGSDHRPIWVKVEV